VVKQRIAVLVVAMAAGACASTHTMSGDLGSFLQHQLTDRGAHISQEVALPPVQATWDFKPDGYGFVMVVRGDHFGDVDSWLRQAFGTPMLPCETHCLYNPRVIGVAIQYVKNPDKTVDIYCIKDPSTWPPT
jgi:hypothetical protein